MSAVQAVKDVLEDIKPGEDETVEQLAQRGLLWQTAGQTAGADAAHAGADLGMDWWSISEEDRQGWIRWAEKKLATAPPKDQAT